MLLTILSNYRRCPVPLNLTSIACLFQYTLCGGAAHYTKQVITLISGTEGLSTGHCGQPDGGFFIMYIPARCETMHYVCTLVSRENIAIKSTMHYQAISSEIALYL